MMKKLLSKVIKFGTGLGYDFETEKKIRLTNTLTLFSSVFAFIQLLNFVIQGVNIYATFSVLIMLLILISIPVLHKYGMKLLPRYIYCFYSLLNVVILSITLGPEVQAQYFIFAYLGLPMVIFGYDIGNAKNYLSFLGLFVFIYLEWHFLNFSPLTPVPEDQVFSQRLSNNIITILVVILLFYFLNKENLRFLDQIKRNIFIEEKNKSLEYFAYLSHDLKEPLRSVSGFTEIIKMEYHDDNKKELNKYFGYVDQGINKMRSLIDALAQLATSGKTSDLESIDINDALTEVKLMLNEVILEKNAAIMYKKLPIIVCYSTDVKQIFANLISNAIKYQRPKQKPIISVTHKENKDEWVFCVEDNGIGIRPEYQERIFKFFTRLHSESEYDGSGLGLSFCRNLVDRHFGKIWVESEVDKGSKFYFSISKRLKIDQKNIQDQIHY
ncbi:GHKL domain-containing protein [Flammeovirga yaeyamensis]|uniref:histidine kinase n=2 Tax=Flammeovirgaceae TaxID=200667 RepID=A0AAX1N7D3_9BACT|nr:signal transduction histidine kinase [Flammeovirga yaeyamensis]NMF36580.1 GHKL domain-containing protein [Flammeovirga yaeyamensis]QWG03464.1 GHKL domain-containing protein [Flammeovirga yaeyamensis]